MEKIEHLETDDDLVKTFNHKCRYWDRGFCKYRKKCKFEHPVKVCETFQKDGKCIERECEKRHPNSCLYYQGDGCERGIYCAYLHVETEVKVNAKKCERCAKFTYKIFFCEFCEKEFCNNCILEQAHDVDYNKSSQINDCTQIHEVTIKVNLNGTFEEESDKENDIEIDVDREMCQCKESDAEIIFKCKDCEKSYCKNCPTRPIGSNCIDCYMEN